MKYSYFPGCSLERNAASYQASSLAISRQLDIELLEVEDWNCCGATEYIALNLTAAYALVARSLALATRHVGIKELVAPCSACYLNLRKADQYLAETPKLAAKVNQALAEDGLSYKGGSLKVRHLLEVVVNDVGFEKIAEKVTKPLQGLKIAPYYGCMIVRPDFGVKEYKVDDFEYPTMLDELLTTLGAEVVYYPMKAQCCGGHMTQISEDSAFEMIRRLIKGAADNGADMIVTVCPMCQLNLDGFQSAMNGHFKSDYHMPILYFSQMMGLAFGMSAQEMGIGSELVDARAALAKIGVEAPPPDNGAAPKPRKKDDKSLPMPRALTREEVKQ